MQQEKPSLLTKTPILFLCALLCCTLWGSAVPGIKLSYRYFGIDTASPGSLLLFAGERFVFAGVLTLAFGSLLEKRLLLPKRQDWRKILILALFQTVLQYIAYYIALSHTSGVAAAIISGSNSFFSILIAALVFRSETLTWNKLLGCVIGFGGVILTQSGGNLGQWSFQPLGEGLMLLSAVFAAVAAVLIGRFSAKTSPILLSGWQFFLGGVVLVVLGLGLGGKPGTISPVSMGTLTYLACVSAAAYSLWGCLLKRNPVSRVTIFGFLTPIMGTLLSALLLDEAGIIGYQTLLALALVCAGIYLVNRRFESVPAP